MGRRSGRRPAPGRRPRVAARRAAEEPEASTKASGWHSGPAASLDPIRRWGRARPAASMGRAGQEGGAAVGGVGLGEVGVGGEGGDGEQGEEVAHGEGPADVGDRVDEGAAVGGSHAQVVHNKARRLLPRSAGAAVGGSR